MKRLSWLLVILSLGAFAIHAQQRTLVETAGNWRWFTCQLNADSSIECSGCVAIAVDGGDDRQECTASFKLGAVVNQNRANALGVAVRARALKRFGVDGGAP